MFYRRGGERDDADLPTSSALMKTPVTSFIYIDDMYLSYVKLILG